MSARRILATRLRATSLCVDRLTNPRDRVGAATYAACHGRVTGRGTPKLIAKWAKIATDPIKLVIVRNMRPTGFDEPCMHAMYV